MRKIFVTGATGVLGRRAIPQLVSAGWDVTAVARSTEARSRLAEQGATPVTVDLFDAVAVKEAVAGHDAVAHLATNIPTGGNAVLKKGWHTNDRLRTEAAAHLSSAVIDHGITRYVQESITFPYVDCGDRLIDESTESDYFWGNQSTVDAEAAAQAVTDAGGAGVTLRFAMFAATDSAHMQTFVAMAGKGVWALTGDDDAYISFINVDDAAAAVVAALDVPTGIYNVAEPEPLRRGEHRTVLAAVVGRDRLRSLPLVERVGGRSVESLSRSHRIDGRALQSVSSWRPTSAALDMWGQF